MLQEKEFRNLDCLEEPLQDKLLEEKDNTQTIYSIFIFS